MGKRNKENSKVTIENGKDQKETTVKSDTANSSSSTTFRIITGSYEHNLLCVSLTLTGDLEVFHPIFHFTAHTQSIRCLAAAKRYLTSGSNDEHIRIYDLQKRKEIGTLLHHSGNITSLEFFEGKWLLSAAADGMIYIWRTKDWEVLGTLKGHKGAVNDFSIHPSGRVAISVGEDKTLRLWNLMTARKASVMKLLNVAIKVQWTLDGEYYVIGYDKKIEIYSVNSEKVYEKQLHSPLHHLDVVKVGEETYVGTSHDDGKIVFTAIKHLIDGEEDPESFALVGHGIRVKHFDVYFHEPNGKYYMASVSSDGKLVVWDLSVKDQVAVYNTGDRLNCCVIVPEDVEKYETMKKRATDSVEDTDVSESEPEQKKRPKKLRKTKAKVSIQMN
jgi:protein MAK11